MSYNNTNEVETPGELALEAARQLRGARMHRHSANLAEIERLNKELITANKFIETMAHRLTHLEETLKTEHLPN